MQLSIQFFLIRDEIESKIGLKIKTKLKFNLKTKQNYDYFCPDKNYILTIYLQQNEKSE